MKNNLLVENVFNKKINQIAIAASYSTDAIQVGINFWLNHLEWPSSLVSADYSQVLQSLLNPQSVLHKNHGGCNFVLFRYEDFIRDTLHKIDVKSISALQIQQLQDELVVRVKELTSAIDDYGRLCLQPTFVILVPSFGAANYEEKWQSLLGTLDNILINKIEKYEQINFFKLADDQKVYEFEEIFDPIRDRLGHIPFTDEYNALQATQIIRCCYGVINDYYKVVVVDCDNTLWQGVCGEVGVEGVVLTEAHLEFQRRLLRLNKSGVLICLCSKNNEEDVWKIFDNRDDMVLQREHIVDARINWLTKSKNIVSLASNLNLDPESFVFIDDNPMECAEVRSNLPQVLVLDMPEEESDIELFANHTWVFDRAPCSLEDASRTEMYRQSFSRDELKKRSNNFLDFIENLELQVKCAPLSFEQLPRSAQLTQKTNQFNLTTKRYTLEEIERFSSSEEYQCFGVSVKDRFGDYGFVGLIIGSYCNTIFNVDTFLLSCRVLGRGVEFKVVNQLAAIVEEKSIKAVKFNVKRTVKNKPAIDFLKLIESASHENTCSNEEAWSCEISTEGLLAVQFQLPVDNDAVCQGASSESEHGINELDRDASRFDRIVSQRRALEQQLIELSAIPFNRDMKQTAQLIRKYSRQKKNNNDGASAIVGTEDKSTSCQNSKTENVNTLILDSFSEILAVEKESLRLTQPLVDFALTSLQILDITVKLKHHYPELPETILFECTDLSTLVEYISEKYSHKTVEKHTPENGQVSPSKHIPNRVEGLSSDNDIAIVGINAYSAAGDVDELWQLLKGGGNCISEVPKSRWDHDLYFDDNREKANKSYGRWGSFIKDIERFDNYFFHISPAEAQLMDPQQRLFMQLVWGLLEDSAYTPKDIPRNTGVFAGISANDYAVLANAAALGGASAYRNTEFFQLANRISYFFDLHGPSMAIDTACSSSGSALYLACESIKRGECPQAIVGGVNLYMHPSRFIHYAQMNILSEDDRCRPFGANASGTIFGEGLAAVMLKPLQKAKDDNDNIYAVIKGCSSNSGGKTNGFTVPNPQAHSALVTAALKQADIDPRTISYVEAHGTGTELGDPIEIRGLTLAFEDECAAQDKQYCALGSVKSNLGHSEAAACLFSVIKVLMQMKHETLVPSINAEQANPLIHFDDTPFYLQRELSVWQRPELSQGEIYPLRASVSSFGAGGSNAHVILEEYRRVASKPSIQDLQIIILSADKSEHLLQRSQQLLSFLQKTPHLISLEDVAFTLRNGRVAMEQRLAFTAKTVVEVCDILRDFIAGNTAGVYLTGSVSPKNSSDLSSSLHQLARSWVSGEHIDWKKQYCEAKGKRISLPIYQFNGDKHWLPDIPSQTENSNLDNIYYWRSSQQLNDFSTTLLLTRNDFFIAEHVVDETLILPGAAVLDMAASGCSQLRKVIFSGDEKPYLLMGDVTWLQPIVIDQETYQLQQVFKYNPDHDCYHFSLCDSTDNKKKYAECVLEWSEVSLKEKGKISLDNIKNRCLGELCHSDHYDLYSRWKFKFGPAFRSVKNIWCGKYEALSQILLPKAQESNFKRFVLHPSLLDGAMQTVVALFDDNEIASIEGLLPMSSGQIICYRPLTTHCYAHVTSRDIDNISGVLTCSIIIYDSQGNCLVEMLDYSVRKLESGSSLKSEQYQLRCFKPDFSPFFIDALDPSWLQTSEKNNLVVLIGNAPQWIEPLFDFIDQNSEKGSESLVWLSEIQQVKSDRVYQIDFNNKRDIDAIFSKLGVKSALSIRVLHFFQDGMQSDFREKKSVQHDNAMCLLGVSESLLSAPSRCSIELATIFVNEDASINPEFSALEGLCGSINIESERISFYTIDTDDAKPSTLLSLLADRKRQPVSVSVTRVRSGTYLQKAFTTIASEEFSQVVNSDLYSGDTLLITGGCGGIANHLLRHLSDGGAKHVILISRSSGSNDREKYSDVIGKQCQVHFYRSDCSDYVSMKSIIAQIENDIGRVDAVIHCAGVVNDQLFYKKQLKDVAEVAAAKIDGIMVLDECTRHLPLKYFVAFSSVSAIVPNPGQSDYAYANAFMDAFCDQRNILVQSGQRMGTSISINWPYWLEGGMQLSNEGIEQWSELSGMQPVTTEHALALFHEAVLKRWPRVIVTSFREDETRVISDFFPVIFSPSSDTENSSENVEACVDIACARSEGGQSSSLVVSTEPAESVVDRVLLLQTLVDYLKSIVADIIKAKPDDIRADQKFDVLGVDSLVAIKIIRQLEKNVGTLRKTLLFENFCINDLASYLLGEFFSIWCEKFDVHDTQEPESAEIAVASQEIANVKKESLMFFESQLSNDKCSNEIQKNSIYSDLKAIVDSLFLLYGREANALARRDIAPQIFIGAERKGYFFCKERNGLLLAMHYVGPESYLSTLLSELNQYCHINQLDLNVLSEIPIETIDGNDFSSSQFAVMQRLKDIQSFRITGKKMRRLRYLVNKYKDHGDSHTVEYRDLNQDKINEQIVTIVEAWCELKKVVNPYVSRVKKELMEGVLSPQHRVFLTSQGGVLHNVIIITEAASDQGYLMDLEFYGADMPAGGLEFAIVNIIQQLSEEGVKSFSLGTTFGAVLDDGSNQYEENQVSIFLRELREDNIFNGVGNLQFKNKFRPNNSPLYLCRPKNSEVESVTDIIVMIADPDVQNGEPALEENKKSSATPQLSTTLGSRIEELEMVFFNVAALSSEVVDFDLQTDSWSQLNRDYVQQHINSLSVKSLEDNVTVERLLQDLLGLEHIVLVNSGRNAESLFCEAWSSLVSSDDEKIVPQNLLFPTFIYHQLDKGFNPLELPDPRILKVDTDELFRGGFDLTSLAELLSSSDHIAFVCLELLSNAAGGYPADFSQMEKLRELTQQYSVTLVFDATRILENALFIQRQNHEYDSLWAVAKSICGLADVITASLCKNFGVQSGGFVATVNKPLFEEMNKKLSADIRLDSHAKQCLLAALSDTEWIEKAVVQRVKAVETLWRGCQRLGIATLSPASGHGVVVDIHNLNAFENVKKPAHSFLVWLYRQAGIRGGLHNAGMQHDSVLSGLVRLSVPLGMSCFDVERVIERLEIAYPPTTVPSIALVEKKPGFLQEANSKYRIVEERTVSQEESPSLIENDATLFENNNLGKNEKQQDADDIAIIGISGRYPEANNLIDFWRNLTQGKDSIQEDIRSRWQALKDQKTDSLWGGFISDVDAFDAKFFSITPREAANMDPQERLFLQVAWAALEDAGYDPDSLCNSLSSRAVGVYVGVVWSLYQTLGFECFDTEKPIAPHSMHWSIANRVSSFMDLHGPSLAVDTACSSSLTAMHLACEAIRAGEIRAALVGGVNLDLHPLKYLVTRSHRMLSSSGRCQSFAKGGDGYVAGEGVGALLLKPLADALRDRDHVYGVVKGSCVNHGGHTSGYTMPNPHAQAALVRGAMHKAGVDARGVNYIEAHGTGTALGDPLEILALSDAFKHDELQPPAAHQYCAIGSVKSNIGHLEAAAGIAGVTKTLLQLQYQYLVPSIHAEELNENIEFEQSPFYLQRSLEPWHSLTLDGQELPLSAGVSSFGAGGTNAHIIIQQPPVALDNSDLKVATVSPHIVVVSAKVNASLKENVDNLRAFLLEQLDADLPLELRFNPSQLNLVNVAYTLQVGRRAMNERLAFVVNSLPDLVQKLELFCDGLDDSKHIFRGTVNDEVSSRVQNVDEQYFNQLVEGGHHGKVAQLWVTGAFSMWPSNPHYQHARRIPLPTYAFVPTKHWIEQKPFSRTDQLHLLLDRIVPNKKIDGGVLFSKTFHENEIFLSDHIVAKQGILAGVCHLSLAHAALQTLIDLPQPCVLEKVIWQHPIVVEGEREIHIALKNNTQYLSYEIRSHDGSTVFSKGELASEGFVDHSDYEKDLEQVRERTIHHLDGKDFYVSLGSTGIQYGEYFKAIQHLTWNDTEAIADLYLGEPFHQHLDAFPLQPTLLDGALQAATTLLQHHHGDHAFLPFAVANVVIIAPLTARSFSYVKKEGSQYHVTLFDEHQRPCVHFHSVVFRPLQDSVASMFFVPRWRPASLSSLSVDAEQRPKVITFIYNNEHSEILNSIEVAYSNIKLVRISMGLSAHADPRAQYHIDLTKQRPFSELNNVVMSEEVIFLGALHGPSIDISDKDSLVAVEKMGVTALFQYLHHIVEELDQSFKIKVVCLDVVTDWPGEQGGPPFGAATVGLVKGFANEYGKHRVNCFDLSSQDVRRQQNGSGNWQTHMVSLLAPVMDWQEDYSGKTWALREGTFYEKYLAPIPVASAESSRFTQGGVYLLIGGSGGIGNQLTQYLCRNYQASVIWLGRSELTESIESKMQKCRQLGGRVDYIQADVSDLEQIKAAVEVVKSRYVSLNGVIHSALHLHDQSFAAMDMQTLSVVMAPKVVGSWNLYHAVKNENLDFMLFFSSAASFLGTRGQSNYVAASYFEDAFACYINRISPFCVKVINWGFWASYATNLSDKVRESVAARGFGAIEDREGMAALERALTQTASQYVVFKGSTSLLKTLGVDADSSLTLNPSTTHIRDLSVLTHASQPILEERDVEYASDYTKLRNFAVEILHRQILDIGFTDTRQLQSNHLSIADLHKNIQLLEEYKPLLVAWLQILENEGIVHLRGHEVELSNTGSTHAKDWASLEAMYKQLSVQCPAIVSHLNLLWQCMRAAPKVLKGALRPTEVLFPGGSTALVEQIYQGNPVMDHYNRTVANIISDYVTRNVAREPDCQIVIMEVGAGVGGTSEDVLAAIDSHAKNVRYIYTDISGSFVNHGKRRFAQRYDFVEFASLNVERCPLSQGFEMASVDLVFASNVLHATASIYNSLQQIKKIMKKNGLVAINETTRRQDFATLTFGLTNGWWLFNDPSCRIANTPLLSVSQWRQQLLCAGFESFVTTQSLSNLSTVFDQSVMLAESDGIVFNSTEHKPVVERLSTPKATEEGNEPATPTKGTTVASDKSLHQHTQDYVVDIFSEVLMMPKSDINLSVNFFDFGVDSILMMDITERFEKDFGKLSMTLMFDYTSVSELVDYFVTHHQEKVTQLCGVDGEPNMQTKTNVADEQTIVATKTVETKKDSGFSKAPKPFSQTQPNNLFISEKYPERTDLKQTDVAIIGIAGRYPEAEDLATFWQNLKTAKNCISEIPRTRWDWKSFFDSEASKPGSSYSKWGGFISDPSKFDPLFFGMSPKDAEITDPNERVFLECAWHTLEDAGYAIGADRCIGRDVGVFVGVMNGAYERISADYNIEKGWSAAQSAYWSIANRVSYAFDFCGPSMALDTACSSSVTAIHMACVSLNSGECEAAIAGGVNLILHPSQLRNLSAKNMLAKDEKNKSFSANADGFVNGEGVGAVLLKPLSRAEADGDRIYGVIKGSAINASGNTAGYNVPNSKQQQAVIRKALDKAGVEDSSVTYIEAHGTGTELGDPIEITGLHRAYGELHEFDQKSEVNQAEPYRSLGSVKSNIGHLEAAAGIAGLTKILLQMQHKMLVPSLHSEQLNPKIPFDETSFKVQQQCEYWPESSLNGLQLPRRAGLSSFGAGGANGHVIIEEYSGQVADAEPNRQPQLIVVSARSQQQLLVYVDVLRRYIQSSSKPSSSIARHSVNEEWLLSIIADILSVDIAALDVDLQLAELDLDRTDFITLAEIINTQNSSAITPAHLHECLSIGDIILLLNGEENEQNILPTTSPDITLSDIAYSLQTGRAPLAARLAIVASSIDELLDRLAAFSSGHESIYYKKQNNRPLAHNNELLTIRPEVEKYLASADLHALGKLWVEGEYIPWRQLRRPSTPRIVSLPGYAFHHKSYWVDSYDQTKEIAQSVHGNSKNVPEENTFLPINNEMINDCVLLQREGEHIAIVSMQEKAQRNMFSARLLAGMQTAFTRIHQDPTIKVIVITGYDSIFAMGGMREDLVAIANKQKSFTDEPFFYQGLLKSELPVIAAIQGHASGGGLLFGLYADLVVMAKEGVYSASFMRYGFTPGMGATFILQNRFGKQIAREMMYTAKSISGEELASRHVDVLIRPREEVLNDALVMARSLADKPNESLQLLKAELSRDTLISLQETVMREQKMHERSFALPEVKQRISQYFDQLEHGAPLTKSSQDDSKALAGSQDSKPLIRLTPPGKAVISDHRDFAAKIRLRPLINDTVQASDAVAINIGADSKEKIPVLLKRFSEQSPVDANYIEQTVSGIIQKTLHLKADELDGQTSFSDLGMDSIGVVETVHKINATLDLSIDATAIYDHPNLSALTTHLSQLSVRDSVNSKNEINSDSTAEGIVTTSMKETVAVDVVKVLRDIVAGVLHIDHDDLDNSRSLNELGVDSIGAVEIMRDINRHFALSIDISELYNYPSIELLSTFLTSQREILNTSSTSEHDDGDISAIRNFVNELSDQQVKDLLEQNFGVKDLSFSSDQVGV